MKSIPSRCPALASTPVGKQLRISGCVALLATIFFGATAEAAPAFQVQSLKEIREHAVVMQRWETSCAAASLATVLTYAFQDPVSERTVVTAMLGQTEPAKVRVRGGFSLLDMKRFVEARGYSGDAYAGLSYADLKLFHAPIVPIRMHGLSHYVVVNAISDHAVLLADPAFGNRSISPAHFQQIWSNGLAFAVTPQSKTTE